MSVGTRHAPPLGPETSVLPTDQLVAWRWRALTQQLPAAGFPAGSAAPALVYIWATLLVAVVTVLGFAAFDRVDVPTAVRESQQDLVRKVAHSLALSLTRSNDAFDRIAETLRAGTAPTAAGLAPLTGESGWAGAAVLQPSTTKALAGSGEAVPATNLAEGTYPVMTADGPATVRVTVIGADRVLAGLLPLRMRSLRLNPDAGHGVYLLTPDGRSHLAQGVDAIPASHRTELFAGVPGITASRSEAIRITEWTDRELVVSAAPVADTGFVVASVVTAGIANGTSMRRGLLLALGVAVTALIAYVLMRAALVKPLRVLLRQAKLDACGAVTKTRRSHRVAEAFGIAQALAVSAETRIRGRRWRPRVTHGLALAAVIALLGPAVAAAVAWMQARPAVPVQLVRDEESRVEAISSTLGAALDSGRGTTAHLARTQATATGGQVEPALRDALAANHRLRGAYLIDAGGAVTASAGRSALRSPQPVPGRSGVVLDPGIDRLPVLYAYQVRADGAAFVAEYDIDYLLGLVRRANGRAVVVDLDLRTVLDSEGYRAFQPLRDDTMRTVGQAALRGETVSRSTDADGRPALVVGAAVSDPAVAHLEWVVVVDRRVDTLQLPVALERRWALLMAAATVAILVVTLIWQHFVVVRPLRRLAAAADRIVAGDFDQPVVPQRHDDIGAIAMCLEICRQVRHTGSARFGGAVRLRGSAANFTAVLPFTPPTQRTR